MKILLYVCAFLLLVSCGKKGGGGSGSAAPTFIDNKGYSYVGETGADWLVGSGFYLYDDGTFMYMDIAIDNINDTNPLLYVQYTKGTYSLRGNKIDYIITEETCPYSASRDLEVYSPNWDVGIFLVEDGVSTAFEYIKESGGSGTEFIIIEDTGCDWHDFING